MSKFWLKLYIKLFHYYIWPPPSSCVSIRRLSLELFLSLFIAIPLSIEVLDKLFRFGDFLFKTSGVWLPSPTNVTRFTGLKDFSLFKCWSVLCLAGSGAKSLNDFLLKRAPEACFRADRLFLGSVLISRSSYEAPLILSIAFLFMLNLDFLTLLLNFSEAFFATLPLTP